MGVVVGRKNPIWVSFSGMGTSSCSRVKLLFSAVWSESLKAWTKEYGSLHLPQALVNESKVCSFRTVAEIRNVVVDSSKRSLMVATNEGMDLRSYV